MSQEQVVRNTLDAINAHDLDKALTFTAGDLTVTDPTLPQAMPRAAFFAQMAAILQAFPDWQYTIQSVTASGDLVTASVEVNATQTGPFQLPGMPALPPSGKRVTVLDRFVFTVHGDRIAAILVDSPRGGGAAEMLRQLGIGLPG